MKKPMADFAAAIQDSVATGRREVPIEELVRPQSRRVKTLKQPRVPSRQGTRAVTAWVDPEVYRALKYLGVDKGATTQELMLEAIDMLFVANGKGKMARRD
jgi:hypothetical protein